MDTLARRQIFLDNFMGFPLRYGGWAISEDILFDILQFCLLSEPKVILDLGTGTTTIILAKYAQRMKEKGVEIEIISVDSSKEWLTDTKKILEKNDLENFVNLVYAPIVVTKAGLYYEIDEISNFLNDKEIDLMVIDGPPGATQKEARYPAMVFFEKNMSKNGVIFLDDGAREDEKNISKRWTDNFTDWKNEYRQYEKGGFVFYQKDSKNKDFLICNHQGKIFENNFEKQEEVINKKDQEIQSKAKEIVNQKNNINILESEKNRLENSKSFKLGNLFFRSIKSPLKWLTFPLNFIKILLNK